MRDFTSFFLKVLGESKNLWKIEKCYLCPRPLYSYMRIISRPNSKILATPLLETDPHLLPVIHILFHRPKAKVDGEWWKKVRSTLLLFFSSDWKEKSLAFH